MSTFVQDIVNVLEAEELRDAILAGHSFGGFPITGVADRAAERIRHVVYVDAAIAQGGQSYFDAGPPEEPAFNPSANASVISFESSRTRSGRLQRMMSRLTLKGSKESLNGSYNSVAEEPPRTRPRGQGTERPFSSPSASVW